MSSIATKNLPLDIADLYDKYGGALYGVIKRIITDENIANDVMQDAFVKIWKYQHQFDATKSSLFTWMMHITRNTAINMVKSKAYRNHTKTDMLAEPKDYCPLQVCNTNIDAIDLNQKLDTLDPKYKVIVELIYLYGYSQSDVSQKLNIPIGTVKSRIRIAIRELRKFYIDNTVKVSKVSILFIITILSI